MEKKYPIYFRQPTQVMYFDYREEDEPRLLTGIAFRQEIICGCCGGVIKISEIYEFAPPTVGCPIHEYDEWCSIDDAIIGGELPDSLQEENEEEENIPEPYPQYYFANLSDEVD